jgi:hypothetical protein
MTVLYRAAEKDQPYFGRGSYWSPSRPYVEHFLRDWAERTFSAEFRIYRLEVQVDGDEVADLRVVNSDPGVPEKLLDDKALDAFAARGFRWLAFQDKGLWENSAPSYVYLGAEPLDAKDDDEEAE